MTAIDTSERRRSAERLQRSLDALLALYEAGQILGSSLQREEIGSRLLEIARRVSSLTAALRKHRQRLLRGKHYRIVGEYFRKFLRRTKPIAGSKCS